MVINGAGENLPVPCESMDVVWSHEVLEHVQDDQLAINRNGASVETRGAHHSFLP